LKEKVEKENEEEKAVLQNEKKESTIQYFLDPNPVTKHRSKKHEPSTFSELEKYFFMTLKSSL
jgi:hypothetical protein